MILPLIVVDITTHLFDFQFGNKPSQPWYNISFYINDMKKKKKQFQRKKFTVTKSFVNTTRYNHLK